MHAGYGTGGARLWSFGSWLALLGVMLAGCISSPAPVVEERELGEPVFTWEEARADPSCVVPLCEEGFCTLWRCADLEEVEEEVAMEQAPLVLTRGTPMLRPPLVVGNPRRWWGRSIAAPSHAEPVFEIPWHNWKTRGQPTPTLPINSCLVPPREPLDKHHIFPQQQALARWFKSKGIDIHAFTVRIPRSFHQWLHSEGAEGGQWNEAWRQFQKKNFGATAEEIWRFAFELMDRFGVNRPFVSYYCGEQE